MHLVPASDNAQFHAMHDLRNRGLHNLRTMGTEQETRSQRQRREWQEKQQREQQQREQQERVQQWQQLPPQERIRIRREEERLRHQRRQEREQERQQQLPQEEIERQRQQREHRQHRGQQMRQHRQQQYRLILRPQPDAPERLNPMQEVDRLREIIREQVEVEVHDEQHMEEPIYEEYEECCPASGAGDSEGQLLKRIFFTLCIDNTSIADFYRAVDESLGSAPRGHRPILDLTWMPREYVSRLLAEYIEHNQMPGVTICSICRNGFLEGQSITQLQCKPDKPYIKHSFHTDCIEQWFEVTDTCPICRTRCKFEKPM